MSEIPGYRFPSNKIMEPVTVSLCSSLFTFQKGFFNFFNKKNNSFCSYIIYLSTMFGEKAFELIKELQRTKGLTISPFNVSWCCLFWLGCHFAPFSLTVKMKCPGGNHPKILGMFKQCSNYSNGSEGSGSLCPGFFGLGACSMVSGQRDHVSRICWSS